ncbi:MAG: hypothetical protein WAM94_05985 [Chromatiaceae bacterium]
MACAITLVLPLEYPYTTGITLIGMTALAPLFGIPGRDQRPIGTVVL